VTANETNIVDNKNFVKELITIKKKLDTELLPLKRPSVYIVRSKARLVRRIPEAHTPSSSKDSIASTKYATISPSDHSLSPPRKDIAPNSLESNPMKESVAPKKVIYQSTGVQTLPPGDNSAFEKIHGRDIKDRSHGMDPAGTFTCGKTGLSAMGRFGKDVGIHTYDLIYGRRFRAPIPTSSVDFQDQGFQIMEIPEREKAIKKAKVKAAMQVMRLKPWMDNIHYKALPELRENMIVHSEQRQVWVKIDNKGRVEGTAPFPNVVCSETYSTGPPEPISVIPTCGDDANSPSIDDVTDFMEYPMPDWDTEEFVVQTVQVLPLDLQMQTFRVPKSGKTSSSVTSINTRKTQSRICSKANGTTIERAVSFDSVTQVNKSDRDRVDPSTEKKGLASTAACITSNPIDVPKGSSGPYKDPLYLSEDPEKGELTTEPHPDLKIGEPQTPIIRNSPREKSTSKAVPREKGLSYSTDKPRLGTSKRVPVSTAHTLERTAKTLEFQKSKRTSTPPSILQTQSISMASVPLATPRNRIEKQTNGVRKSTDGNTRAPELGQRRKATVRKEAIQLPNALFGAFRRKMDKISIPVSQHDSSALQQNKTETHIEGTSSSAPTKTPSSRRWNSLDSPSGISDTLRTSVPSAFASQHTFPPSHSNTSRVPPAHTPSLPPRKRSPNNEHEDLVDYSDSELIPSPKKQRLKDQESNSSKLYGQATNVNSVAGRVARDLENSVRVAQQYIRQLPPPITRKTPTPGVLLQKSLRQRLSPRNFDALQQSLQEIPQLQMPSQQTLSQQTSLRQAPSQQTSARPVPSHQAASQTPAPQDAASQQSILQPARRKREPRQGMNWVLSLAGTGLLLNRKTK
jgi:hypothetical protein